MLAKQFKPEFLIAAIVILTIEVVFLRKKFYSVSRANKKFFKFVAASLAAACFDLCTNILESFIMYVPQWIALTVRATFFSAAVIALYCGFGYFAALGIEKKQHVWLEKIIFVLMILYFILAYTNTFTHLIIYYDGKGRVSGPLWGINYIIPCILAALMLTDLLINNIKVSKAQLFYICSALVLSIAGGAVEWAIHSEYLLLFFGVSIGITAMLFGLETPDYRVMLDTLEELENSKAESEMARIEAEAANDAKTKFLARMSHEIRTPINGILGMNEMVLRENKDEAIEGYASDIKRAAHNLLSIINDILDFSKIDSNKMQIIPTEYKLANILRDVWNLFDFAAREKNLKLDFIIDENLPSVLYGDDIRLKQVLANLLSNAVKYTDAGSITFSISESGREDELIDLRFSVKDTGRGIKTEDIQKLCMAFERIDEKNVRTIEGTGLGMSIVSKTLELMNSKLLIDSVFGQGSEFAFVLRQTIVREEPVGPFEKIRESATEKAAETVALPFKAPRARILVVDDNLINLKVFTGLLKDTEIMITEAQSGPEALEKCRDTKYNAIFLDHLMPGMDGVETLKELRRLENNPNENTPTVCLTANAMQGARDGYIVQGFDDALFKPIEPAKLFDMLKRMLPADLLN